MCFVFEIIVPYKSQTQTIFYHGNLHYRMRSVRELYIGKGGRGPKQLADDPIYLSQLALAGAIEIDNHLLGRNNDFSNVQEFSRVLAGYCLNDASDVPYTQYSILSRAVRKDSEKKIGTVSELVLELQSLSVELGAVPDVKNMPSLRSALCEISRVFCEAHERARRQDRLVA